MRNYPQVLLDPEQTVVAIIDHQPQMYFGVSQACRLAIMNGVTGLAKAAKVFNVPCVLSTVTAKTFAGNMISEVQQVYPDVAPIDRTTLNAWEDQNFKKAVQGTGRRKLVIAGLWTEVCVAFPTLSAIQDGYEVYVVADACGGSSQAAHDMGMQRMIQAGAKPMTWQQVLLEFQRDWNDKTTYAAVMDVIKQHGVTYGLGVEYTETMLH